MDLSGKKIPGKLQSFRQSHLLLPQLLLLSGILHWLDLAGTCAFLIAFALTRTPWVTTFGFGSAARNRSGRSLHPLATLISSFSAKQWRKNMDEQQEDGEEKRQHADHGQIRRQADNKKNRHALEGREGRGMYTYSLKLHGLVRSWAGLVVVVVLLSLPFSEGGSFLSLPSPR